MPLFALTCWDHWPIFQLILLCTSFSVSWRKWERLSRDALADLESFLSQVPSNSTNDRGTPCPQCHLVQQHVPSITFTSEDMLLKNNKHDRLLYYTGYIDSTCDERIQVYSGSALSIVPKRLLYFLGISLNRLLTMTTTLYAFNAGSTHPLGKIRLRYQIGDVNSKVMIGH